MEAAEFSNSPWGEAEAAPKSRGFSAAEFVKNYRQGAREASKGAAKRFEAFQTFSESLVKRFIEMARQAVEIALSKFLVELCAMIIAAVGAAMVKRHNRPVEITTPGVFFNQAGQPAAAPAGGPQQNLWSGSPFDSGWSGGSRAGAW